MRIDRVKYTAHYDEFGILKDQWIGLEAQIDDTEVPEKQLDAIKEITEQWYKKQGTPNMDMPISQQLGTTILPVIDKAEERQIGITAEMILSSPDKTILNSYRLIIKGKPELERAFELRNDELNRMGYK